MYCQYHSFFALLAHSVRQKSFFKLATIRFFIVCIARSTTTMTVFLLGVQYSFSMFFDLQNSLYSSELKAPALSSLGFTGIPYGLDCCVKKLMNFFVFDVLQFFTVGHLLNLSTACSNWLSSLLC